MPRRLRPYTPGGVFHITTRTIRHVRWFKDAEQCARIITIMRDCLPLSDAQLLAFAIMPTHLHLLVRQGSEALSHLMQPMLARIARSTARKHHHKGYVFERRFRDRQCKTAEHLRTAIWYIHRNPVKSKLCADASEYEWSSWYEYAATGKAPPEALIIPRMAVPRELFAGRADLDLPGLQKAYVRYHAYRDERASCTVPEQRPQRLRLPTGDAYWVREFCQRPPRTLENAGAMRPDLCDLARKILRTDTPGLTLEELRTRRGAAPIVAVRREIVLSAARAGYRNVDIARYLHISESVVSRIAQHAFITR